MQIVRGKEADADSIAFLVSTSNKDVADKFGININNTPKHPSFYNRDWVLSDFKHGEEYFIYKHNSIEMGCVAFENPRPGVAYLNRLSVLPEYQNKGIGELLVNYIFEYANTNNIQKISIGIIAEHLKLKKWYLKLGFVAGEIKEFEHLPFKVQYMSLVVIK